MVDFQQALALVSSQLANVPIPDFPLTILDFIIIAVILFYAYEGVVLGFLLATVDLVSFIVSFLLALLGYAYLGPVLMQLFNMPQGFANAVGFFLVALVSEVALNIIFRKLLIRFENTRLLKAYTEQFRTADHYLGIVPGITSSLVIISFLLTVIISLPSSPLLKEAVSSSIFGSRLVTHAAGAERILNDVFGGAIHETLNFLTIEPESDETLPLHFTVASPTVDSQSELTMLASVNEERRKEGLPPLVMDAALRDLARSYARSMLQGGYFSHYDSRGKSPFDRMDEAAITYLAAGENLALAPNTELAMQGLMNSPGHKANILSPDFGTVGIGVMDGGIYGKMFVQEFTD